MEVSGFTFSDAGVKIGIHGSLLKIYDETEFLGDEEHLQLLVDSIKQSPAPAALVR